MGDKYHMHEHGLTPKSFEPLAEHLSRMFITYKNIYHFEWCGKRIDTVEIENGTHYTSMVLFLYQCDRFKLDQCLYFSSFLPK